MIRAVIVDDDKNSILAATSALKNYEDIVLVDTLSCGKDLYALLEKTEIDFVILDIELEKETGFEIADTLRKQYPGLLFVFLTGHSSYAIDGYDFQPVNFLTKPINQMKMNKTIEEVRNRLYSKHRQNSAKVMFKLPRGFQFIDVRDICYIERIERKNYIVLEKETIQIASYTMKELEEMLVEHGFFLSHQSYIVSLYRVVKINDLGNRVYEMEIKGRKELIPLSRSHYNDLLKYMEKLGI